MNRQKIIGALAVLLASCIAWGLLMLMSPLMPDRPALVTHAMPDGTRTFDGKNAYIQGTVSVASLEHLPAAALKIVPSDYAVFELYPQEAKTPVFVYVPRNSPLMEKFQALPTAGA